jgi:hypothetical protein
MPVPTTGKIDRVETITSVQRRRALGRRKRRRQSTTALGY